MFKKKLKETIFKEIRNLEELKKNKNKDHKKEIQ